MRPWLLLLCACTVPFEDPPVEAGPPLAVGETRAIELRYLRFDVSSFEKTLTKADVLALPQNVRDRLWLLDLDLTSAEDAPRLLDNALATIRALDPATLAPAAQNLQRLLAMTPDSADLRGTRFESLLDLAPLFGIAPSRVLADLMGIGIDEEFLAADDVAKSILMNVIRSHPNAQTRLGPRTQDNPEGVYPVALGRLPVTLADAAEDFAGLSARFGPYEKDGIVHPGFIVGDTKARVLTDDFAMTVRVNANALPYKGVELGRVARASVNPIPSQIQRLFDFDDPNWLRLEGLTKGTPVIESLTFRIIEAPGFIPGGTSPIPVGYGNSPVWSLPSYTFEALVADTVRQAFAGRNAALAYQKEGSDEALVSASVADGWLALGVAGDVGSPPQPQYIWDVLLECAQVRLHDNGVAEGEAVMDVPLTNIPVGVDTQAIADTIAENLRADPTALLEVASRIIDSTDGAADFYYVYEDGADWLHYVAPEDMGAFADGSARRPYTYHTLGFFADEALSEKISQSFEGRERVRISAGDTIYAADDEGLVFRLDIGAKPSQQRVGLSVTRMK